MTKKPSKKPIRTISEINNKISEGNVVVITAEEMTEIVREKGVNVAAKEVDVVTTGTFGAMCSSGAFFNFGHSPPPVVVGSLCYMARYRSALRCAPVFLPTVVTIPQR